MITRRDFLRLGRGDRGKVLELSCRMLFMRCSDARSSADPSAMADRFEAHEPWMGEPTPALQRRSAVELIAAVEEQLRDVQVLRLLDPEWLDSIDGRGDLEAVIEAFRARGGIVERA
jgi:hypothetical protein